MLVISLVLSAILLLLSIAAAVKARDPQRTYWNCWIGIALAVIPCFLFFPVYFYHALAMGLFATGCSVIHVRRPIFLAGTFAIPIAVYGLVLYPEWRRVQEAVQMYRPESLVDRLAYEDRYYQAAGQPLPPPLSEDDRQRSLGNTPYEARIRFEVLKTLHDDSTQLFIQGAGFGVGRMRRLRPSDIKLGDPIRLAEPVSLPEPTIAGLTPPVTAEDGILANDFVGGDMNLNALIHASRDDFLDPLGFGYFKNRSDVAGFLSHRFTKAPTSGLPAIGSWRIDALDLISMLKHREPVAYLSKNLPRMDELRDAPTRPLDEFERERLPKLQSGETLSAAQGPRRLRVLGALRAQEVCLNCHTATKDQLLGAFSYDLRLDLPAAANR